METLFLASEDARWEGGSAISMQAATRSYLAKRESTSRAMGEKRGVVPQPYRGWYFPLTDSGFGVGGGYVL